MSDHSSELFSDDSIEHTAKYFFIEDQELQANLRKLEIEYNLNKQIGSSMDKVKEKIRTS